MAEEMVCPLAFVFLLLMIRVKTSLTLSFIDFLFYSFFIIIIIGLISSFLAVFCYLHTFILQTFGQIVTFLKNLRNVNSFWLFTFFKYFFKFWGWGLAFLEGVFLTPGLHPRYYLPLVQLSNVLSF